MKNLSSILLIAAMLSVATSSFASEPIYSWTPRPGEKIKLFSNEEFFSKADYIIEARFAGWKFTTRYDAGGNYNPNEIYTSLLMIVTHIYKNDETMRISLGDTLNYVRKGGHIIKPAEKIPEMREPYPAGYTETEIALLFGEEIYAPQPVDYETGEMGGVSIMPDEYHILFMKKSDLPENPDASKRNKHPKVSMLQDLARATIKMGSQTSTTGQIWGLNGLHFDNRYELYKYMEQFEGVKVPLSDPGEMRWYLDDETFKKYIKERNVKWRESNNLN